MTAKLPTATVRDLIAALSEMPPDAPVRVWLPGSTLALGMSPTFHGVGPHKGTVLIEGNVDPGSWLLDDYTGLYHNP